MKHTLKVLVFVGLFAVSIGASAEDLEKTINNEYKGRVLVLRHPLTADSLEYDTSGAILTKSTEGTWTMFGHFQTEKIKLAPSELELKGHRLNYRFDEKTKHLMPFRDGRELKLKIQLAKSITSADEAKVILDHVFALSSEDVVKSAPVPWQHYLAIDLKLIPDDKAVEGGRLKTLAPGEVLKGLDGAEIYRVRPGVTAPKAIYQPEPEFSEEARKAHYQGVVGLTVVIDKSGLVQDIQIKKPSGMGLDEQALSGVKIWKFQPAMRDGQAVAVQVYIEVSFAFFK